MIERVLPDTKLEFMHEIGSKQLIDIEAVSREELRECALDKAQNITSERCIVHSLEWESILVDQGAS